MKKVISLILCLALFVSVLGVTALATTDNYIVHYRLEKAILTSSYSTRWHNFPANKSTATLIEDLYSNFVPILVKSSTIASDILYL